jgi:hypothetical protein
MLYLKLNALLSILLLADSSGSEILPPFLITCHRHELAGDE